MAYACGDCFANYQINEIIEGGKDIKDSLLDTDVKITFRSKELENEIEALTANCAICYDYFIEGYLTFQPTEEFSLLLAESCVVKLRNADCCSEVDAQRVQDENAKWYFYCYSSLLSTKTRGNIEVDPLVCDLRKNSEVKKGKDTVAIYFNSFYKDSNNFCTYWPIDIVGVYIVRHQIYLPIYNHIEFDSMANDSVTFAYMASQERSLIKRFKDSGSKVNSWLSDQLQKRNKIN